MKIRRLINNQNPAAEDAIPGSDPPAPWTIAVFCRVIGVHHNSYARFMKAKTAMGGCQSGVYSGAYAFFEKKRIWEGVGKTDARKKVEEESVFSRLFHSFCLMDHWFI
jgi:hypothetical protein